MEIAVSQSLNLENIRKHLKYSFGTFSKTGGFNGSFNYKTEHFCFTNEKLEIKDTKKLSGIKIFLKTKVLF
jgi:cytochrome c oxidase assembly protein Cox11